MASNHQGGNIQPGLDLEEHDGDINAKRVSLASAATIFVVSNVGSAQLSGSVTVGSLVSAATIYAVVNTSAAGVGESMVTLFPSPNFIGITTVANKDRTITGNVTLSDSKTFIGLVTVVQSSAARTITGNLTLSDSKAFIGLVTAVPSTTVRSISGNVTLSDAKTYIGLVTATIGGTPNVAVVGNVTLSDSKGFIGLVTSIPAFMSDTTIFSFIASNASHTTIFTPPSNQRWYLKNLILGSAGNVRAEIRSGATQFVPYISLATSGGYVLGPDQAGIPSRANNDAFVVGLQSAVTVSGMANVYFKAG